MKHNNKKEKGFTLMELLVVIGIIAILAAAVIVALNPARQFAQARNSQRVANINAILNAIGQNMADNKGVFTCTDATVSNSASAPTAVETITNCLAPKYMPNVPSDPSATTTVTHYYVSKDDTSGRFTVCAPLALTDVATTTACVTR